MRRIYKYSIGKESIEDMIRAKRFNPCLEITFRDRSGQHTHKLTAGYDDELDVYRDGPETLVLAWKCSKKPIKQAKSLWKSTRSKKSSDVEI